MRRVGSEEVLEHHLVVAGGHPLVWGGGGSNFQKSGNRWLLLKWGF